MVKIYKYQKLWSFPERTEEFCKSKMFGKTLHVCCGNSILGDIRIDIEKQEIQDSKSGFKIGDMYNLPVENNTFDSVLIAVLHTSRHRSRSGIQVMVTTTKDHGHIIIHS